MRRTIRVVLWGTEEFGLIGGRAYAGANRVFELDSRVADAGLPLFAEMAAMLALLGIEPLPEISGAAA